MRRISLFMPLLAALPMIFAMHFEEISWKELETGLHYASVNAPVNSSIGDSKIDILKINPEYFSFNLLCAGQKKSDSKTIQQWCDQNNMLIGVNAGMFKLEGDFNVSTGYMRNYSYINNPSLNPNYKAVFAFNASDTSMADAHIVDMTCEDLTLKKKQYNSFSQCIRMIDCNGKNIWALQEKKWSMVIMGEDQQGNILFIFTRSPYRVHDYINMLLGLPLQLKRLMYLEGGPEASFYINHPKLKLSMMGSYETGFNESDNNKVFWEIPNVIGVSKK